MTNKWKVVTYIVGIVNIILLLVLIAVAGEYIFYEFFNNSEWLLRG